MSIHGNIYLYLGRGNAVTHPDLNPTPGDDVCNSSLPTGYEWAEDFCGFQTTEDLLRNYAYVDFGTGYFEEWEGKVVNSGRDGVFLSYLTGSYGVVPIEGITERTVDGTFEQSLGSTWTVTGDGTNWSLDNTDLPPGVPGFAAIRAAGNFNQLTQESLPLTVGMTYEARYWIKVLAGQAEFTAGIGGGTFTPLSWAGDDQWHEVVYEGQHLGDPYDPVPTSANTFQIRGATATAAFKVAGITVKATGPGPVSDWWNPTILRNDPANGGHAALYWEQAEGAIDTSNGRNVWWFEAQYERGWFGEHTTDYQRAKTHFVFELEDVTFDAWNVGTGDNGSYLTLGLIRLDNNQQGCNFYIQRLPSHTEPRLMFEYRDTTLGTWVTQDVGSAEYLIGSGPYIASVEADGSLEDGTMTYRAWLHPYGTGGIYIPVASSPTVPLLTWGAGRSSIWYLTEGEFKLTYAPGSVSPPLKFKIFELGHVVGHIIGGL